MIQICRELSASFGRVPNAETFWRMRIFKRRVSGALQRCLPTTAPSSSLRFHATFDSLGSLLAPLNAVLTNREGVTRQQLMDLGNLQGSTKGRGIKREASDPANNRRATMRIGRHKARTVVPHVLPSGEATRYALIRSVEASRSGMSLVWLEIGCSNIFDMVQFSLVWLFKFGCLVATF